MALGLTNRGGGGYRNNSPTTHTEGLVGGLELLLHGE